MKTSSFYLYSGEGRVSIARTAPRRVAAGFRMYKALAPGKWLFDPAYKDYAVYRERYFREILGPLDTQKTWDNLHALVDGHEPVLLCHEHLLKSGDWCHRRMVAEWFEDERIAREHGITYLHPDSSLNAERFYLCCGYRITERAKHIMPSGSVMDCVKMHKDL